MQQTNMERFMATLPRDFDNRLEVHFEQLTRETTAEMKQARQRNLTARQIVISIHRAADDVVRAVLDRGETPDCKRGCNYCCHYRVDVSATEALALADFAAKLPEPKRVQVTASLASNVARTSKLTKTQHIQTNIACAFLSDGECLAYEVRPLACRRHHSMQLPTCEATFADPLLDTPHIQSAGWIAGVDVVTAAHAIAAGQAGFDNTHYELNAAVKAALETPAASRRWRDGKVALPQVRDRAPPALGN
jgi:Fe-S-cluster containining protein